MEISEIKSKLEKLPHDIYAQAKKVEKARIESEKKSLDVKVSEAKEYVKIKASDAKKTIAEIEAMVLIAAEKEKIKEITTEGKYRGGMILLDSLSNEFTAVRKLANLAEIEMRIMPS